MEFKNFSLFIKHTKVGKTFAEALESGKVFGTQCEKCGRTFFPPRPECPDCLEEEMAYVEIPTKGTLLTFTAIFVPPAHYGISPPKMPFARVTQTPCPVGVVEVGNGLRVMGWIPDVDLKDLKVGDPFEVEARALRNGQLTIVLKPAGGNVPK